MKLKSLTLFLISTLMIGMSGEVNGQVEKSRDNGVKTGESNIPEKGQGNTDWFSEAGWGLFVHFLYDVQGVDKRIANTEEHESWDDMINKFDTEKFATDVAETGAKYVNFTMMQRTRYMSAPNKTYYNKLTGYKTGEACSSRDLVADLITSLENIK